ncbi:SMP-30/gluconolactonase/LRE family protein [Paracoccus sp. Z330]|uniref:SMP-30/gluconolactonase/LRE family protein n=1 Tax=Paracoccus onchidii TaxID=3017813 RepID=A0ABT4ZEA2_9RHOB|nr:SMP-30/gluconolactonase/LRE family protein [Paracoccus onchidii]MDB6177686.1 SMP-30/gluconolactonase/LRE family protein [Paracoccus onchidii]
MTQSVPATRRLSAGSAPLLTLPGVALERLFDGGKWCEGPVYFPASDSVVFSDIPNNRLMQWIPGLGCRVLNENSDFANGGTRDAQGRLISCRHLSHSVVRIEHDGSQTTLASHYKGAALNSPNDLVVAADGAIWFTDPSYGILSDYEGKRRDSEIGGCFVYRIAPGDIGHPQMVCDSLLMPNGLAFSPDESKLYVADSSRSHFSDGHHDIFVFDVIDGCRLGPKQHFFRIDHGVPDGLRIDELGNLWCSSARGIEVISPLAEHLDHIPVPEPVANLTFGGAHNATLFITASTSLYSITVGVRGANARMPAP